MCVENFTSCIHITLDISTTVLFLLSQGTWKFELNRDFPHFSCTHVVLLLLGEPTHIPLGNIKTNSEFFDSPLSQPPYSKPQNAGEKFYFKQFHNQIDSEIDKGESFFDFCRGKPRRYHLQRGKFTQNIFPYLRISNFLPKNTHNTMQTIERRVSSSTMISLSTLIHYLFKILPLEQNMEEAEDETFL